MSILPDLIVIAEPVPNRSNLREYEDPENGGAGIPVNSWTIALKFDVSVVRTVVGARLEALVRFLEFRPVLVLVLMLVLTGRNCITDGPGPKTDPLSDPGPGP